MQEIRLNILGTEENNDRGTTRFVKLNRKE